MANRFIQENNRDRRQTPNGSRPAGYDATMPTESFSEAGAERSPQDEQNFNSGRNRMDNDRNSPFPGQPTPMGLQNFADSVRASDAYAAGAGAPSLNRFQAEGRDTAQTVARIQTADNPNPVQPIGKEQIRKARQVLQKYKDGKQHLEDEIVKNEKWWKQRHWDLITTEETRTDPKPASGWLFNTVISKHADFMDNYPSPVVLPRERGDVEEAQKLSSIIPVILEQNNFRETYSAESLYKIKHGTGIYSITWDASKLNGLGDISIRDVDALSIFWEPGIKDIQDSKNVFFCMLVDRETLEEDYPNLNLSSLHSANSEAIVKTYWHDDSIDTTGKALVIDWYYHKRINGKKVLHYVKFVDDIVLYATENQTERPMMDAPVRDQNGMLTMGQQAAGPSMAETGLYNHGMYPFVFDPLFLETDSPCGFGFVNICKNAQTTIDIYNNAFEKNVQFGATPRWFTRSDRAINLEEFNNFNTPFVSVAGSLDETVIRAIDPPQPIQSAYLELLNMKIDEMKETTGNRDVTNGGTTAGATAASAIAALQESSGKTSRDQISTSYTAYKKVITMVIELIRQFYDVPRVFRIVGKGGQVGFTSYSNEGLQEQNDGPVFGEDIGYRLPVFDVQVEAEKQSPYSRLSQNELALSFYNGGFFDPSRVDQALACIEMMDFQGKDEVEDRIRQNGGMYQQILNLQTQMLQMAQMIDQLTNGAHNLAPQIADEINGNMDMLEASGGAVANAQLSGNQESGITRNARQRAAETTNPL